MSSLPHAAVAQSLNDPSLLTLLFSSTKMTSPSPPSITEIENVLCKKIFCLPISYVMPSLPVALFWNGIHLNFTVGDAWNDRGVSVKASISPSRTTWLYFAVVAILRAFVRIVSSCAFLCDILCGESSSSSSSCPILASKSSVALA